MQFAKDSEGNSNSVFHTNSSPVSYCVIEMTPREYMWIKYFTDQMFSEKGSQFSRQGKKINAEMRCVHIYRGLA